MMPWRTWLVRLSVSGALAIVAGCGSGDVPDPSSDSQAAADPAASDGGPQIPAGPAAPTPVVAAKAAPREDAESKPEEAKSEEASPATTEATPPPSSSSPAPDKNSATAEMLAMATGGAPGANPNPAAGGDTAPGASPAPGGPPGMGGMGNMQRPGGGPPGNGGMGAMQRPGGGPPGGGGPGMMGMASGMGPGAPGGAGGNPGDMMKGMQAGMQNQMARQGGAAGGPGGPGMAGMAGAMGGSRSGGPGGADAPADFHTPEGGVTAFLNALKARDLDRLSEATAIHAQIEAAKKNQDIFKRIYDGSLSASELDDLAKKLEGFKIIGENPPKSSGRIDVIISKNGENNSRINRIVTVRHEKKGWMVCDVSGPAEFKNPRMTPNRTPTRK